MNNLRNAAWRIPVVYLLIITMILPYYLDFFTARADAASNYSEGQQVLVLDFISSTESARPFGKKAADALTVTINQTGRYKTVSKQFVSKVAQDFKYGDLNSREQALQLAARLNVDLLVCGKILDAQVIDDGKQAKVRASAEMIEVQTGQVLFTDEITALSAKRLAGGGDQAVLLEEAASNAGFALAQNIKAFNPVTGVVLSVSNREVVINLGRNNGLHKGSELSLIRETRVEKSAGRFGGIEVNIDKRIIGKLSVKSFDEYSSVCTVLNSVVNPVENDKVRLDFVKADTYKEIEKKAAQQEGLGGISKFLLGLAALGGLVALGGKAGSDSEGPLPGEEIDEKKSTVTLTGASTLPADGLTSTFITVRVVDIDNNPLANHKIVLHSSRNSSSAGLSAEPAAAVLPPAATGDDLSPAPGKIRPGSAINKSRPRLNTFGSAASSIGSASFSRRQRIQQPDADSSMDIERQTSQVTEKTVVRKFPDKGLFGRPDRDRQSLRQRFPRRASGNTSAPLNMVSGQASGPDIITPVISDLTDASGTVTFAVRSTAAIESPGVSFYAYDSTAQRTIVQRVNNIIFTPGQLAQYKLTVSSSLVRKGETFSISVEAQDQYGNFIKTAAGTVGLSAAVADTSEAVVLNPSPATVTLSAGVGILSGLVLGSTGNIKLTAFGGGGALGITDITVIAEQLPTAPAIANIVEGDRQVSVQWDPVEDASVTGYRVYQSTLQNGQYTQVTQVSKDVTAATVPGLANNTDYWFKVASYNTTGAESFSAARKATPQVSSITGFKVETTNDAGQWVPGGTAVSWKAGKAYSVRISPVDNTGALMISSQSLTVNLRAGTTRHMGTMKFSTDGENFNAVQATVPAGQQFVVVKAMDTLATYVGTIGNSVTVAVEEGQTPFRSGESGAISIYPDDQYKLGFSTMSQSIAVGSVSDVVNIQVQDQHDNLVTGINEGGMVSVKGDGSTSLMFSRDGANPWNSVIDIDIVNGVGSFYFRDTNAGTPSIRVEDNTRSLQQTQAIQSVKIVSKSIKITSLPYTLFTGEVPPTPVTVEALNEDGTRDTFFTNQDITVTAPSSGTVLFCDTADGTYQAQPFILRMSDGLGQFYFKSTLAGTPIIKVDSGALGYGYDTQQQAINQRVPNSIEISSTKDQMIADGIQTAEIICVVKDSTGNPVSGVRVNFSKEPSEMGGVSPAFGLTNSDGIITAHFTAGTISGIATVRATVADHISVNKSTSIELVAGKPAIILLSAPSGTRVQVGGNKLPVKATVYDRFGNLVADNTEVVFKVSDREKATISSPSTTVNGVASTSLQSGNKSGSVDIEASIVLLPPDSSTIKSALLHLSVYGVPHIQYN